MTSAAKREKMRRIVRRKIRGDSVDIPRLPQVSDLIVQRLAWSQAYCKKLFRNRLRHSNMKQKKTEFSRSKTWRTTYIHSSGNIILPHPVTIRSVCSSYKMNPQHEHQPSAFLRYMAKRILDLDDRQRVVTLMVDEIHMKPFFEYRGGNITGTAHNSPEAANSALVFMVQSLTSKFKEVAHIVPVCSADGKFLHNVLKEVILGSEKIGYKVVCVVTDNNKINRKAMEHFDQSSPTGSSSETPFVYEHPCDPARPLFFVIDPVHILKCICNSWLKQKNHMWCFFPLEMDSEHTTGRRMLTASFQTIRDVYNAEVGQLLRHAHTLTRKGFFPTDIEKQNTPCKGKRLRDEPQRPVSSLDDPQVVFLYNLLDWLDEWKNRTAENDSGKLTKEIHASLHQTTHGLMEIARYCLTELNMFSVLFGKIQIDGLKNRFGKHRQLAGSQYHVSIRQIYEGENKMHL
ncbi:hypothetical protein HPB51_001138 [Rhipicephalus microplus]|uniref:Transposable element P transposase-like RNase H domain-containing protein n=1 Tax=Rhipicephalus microplus TaxID=6941 RepID=A0A9J6EV21_RHIMP|nr:hypothetical protein HPB51_001138 [Rhipicephalus microplus]